MNKKKLNFEFILGLIILIISFLALIAISSKISFYKPVNNFSLESSFFDIGQLDIGSDVKINGVKVGEVNKIYYLANLHEQDYHLKENIF